ncbi:FASCICLIN-like arabinogalactan 2 [Perilla frutescens var. hirtella]|nr:FASCICLIN-like arabinogalactan 2 [Perilla frutescens var. hirtella]
MDVCSCLCVGNHGNLLLLPCNLPLPPSLSAAVPRPATLICSRIPSATDAHNITHILEKYPEFSTFNHYLTVTQLFLEINRRETITVCAVDNAGMSDLLSKHLTLGAKKLHQITNGTGLAAIMFQATGSATGSAGFINITDLKAARSASAPRTTAASFPPRLSSSSTPFCTTSSSFRPSPFSPLPKPRLRRRGRARSTSQR